MLVHIFGATDCPCCVNFDIETLARENCSAMTIVTLLRSFYIDYLLKLVTSEQQAFSLIKKLVDLMKAGGLRLTKFINNNKKVMKIIPETEKAKSLQRGNGKNNKQN